MQKFRVQPTPTAEWQSLVVEAQARCQQQLDDELESYLVFLLDRFMQKPDMVMSVLGLEYLQSMQELGHIQREHLREVGDKCLLFSGLFPGRASRRRVKVSYFVQLGRSAYENLSANVGDVEGELFVLLSENFVPMMDVLQAMRNESDQQAALDLLQNMELWQDTGSQQAYKILTDHTDGFLVQGGKKPDGGLN